MIGRRPLLAVALGSILAGAHIRPTQAADRVFRIGILRPTASSKDDPRAGALNRALVEQSRSEGRSLEIEVRYADGQLDRLPALARELLQRPVDLIIALGASAVRAAQSVTTTVPIVILGNFDPVALGLVSSLARPGGNTTGVLITPQDTLAAKKLELLREVVPGATRIALLAPNDAGFEAQKRETIGAASAQGLTLQVVDAGAGDYVAAFDAMVAGRAQAVLVGATTFFVRDRKPIIALALKHRLPTIWEWEFQVNDGGLMAYGANSLRIYQRVAIYADRIFKGAKPGDLPVEQPARVELVVNLKTAKAIGLNIPESLLARADEVIQ